MLKVIASFLMLWILILVLILSNCRSGSSQSDSDGVKARSGVASSGRWYPSGM